MPRDLSLIESVILEPDETGEMLGRVLDGSVEKLHADMQRGVLAASDFGSFLTRMQSLRDDIVSRADAGEALPSGQRLCFFTHEIVDLLSQALSAALASPEKVGVPADRLRSLRDRFALADEAVGNRAPARVIGRFLPRYLPSVLRIVLLLYPAVPGASLGLWIWGESPGTVDAVILGLGFAYLSDFAARRWGFSIWLRLIADTLWPFFLFCVAPVYLVVWLVLRAIRRLTKAAWL